MAVCVRLAAVQMEAAQIASVRFAGSFVVLVMATRARALRPRPGNAGRLIVRGLLGGAAITCYYAGIERAGAGLATLLHATHPIFTALFAVLLLGEAFTSRLAGAKERGPRPLRGHPRAPPWFSAARRSSEAARSRVASWPCSAVCWPAARSRRPASSAAPRARRW
jgi:hypothetical protein